MLRGSLVSVATLGVCAGSVQIATDDRRVVLKQTDLQE